MMPMRLPLLSALAAVLLLAPAAQARPMFEKVDSAQLTPQAHDFKQGSEDAPVTVIEYASFSCPHCAKLHKIIAGDFEKNYIKTGKVLYILRPFPLNEPGLKSAELVDCIGEEQGADRYYTFARVLFEGQSKWAFDTSWQSALETFAKVGGVSKEMFDRCINDSAREIKMLNQKRMATKELGVDRTPYLFINGHRYDDEHTYEKISAFVDSLIKDQAKDAKAAKDAKPADKDTKPTEEPAKEEKAVKDEAKPAKEDARTEKKSEKK